MPKVWLLTNEGESIECYIVIIIIRQKITTLYMQVASFVVYLVVLYRNLFVGGKH